MTPVMIIPRPRKAEHEVRYTAFESNRSTIIVGSGESCRQTMTLLTEVRWSASSSSRYAAECSIAAGIHFHRSWRDPIEIPFHRRVPQILRPHEASGEQMAPLGQHVASAFEAGVQLCTRAAIAPLTTSRVITDAPIWTAATKAGSGIERSMSLLKMMFVNEHSMYAAAHESTLAMRRESSLRHESLPWTPRLRKRLWRRKRQSATPAQIAGSQYSWITRTWSTRARLCSSVHSSPVNLTVMPPPTR
mmetsp:Transcript_3536/g.9421  ORF Transcript_3536/g.9421 Transcript_3536/m.9421 type:complete len:247 (-) Transcript_3536:200-940(-)